MSRQVILGSTPGPGRGTWVIAAVLVAIMHLTVGFFTVGAIGLVSVPAWGIVVLVGTWAAAAALLVRTVRRTPLIAMLVPVANALVLWGVVMVGEAWLGWTA